MKPVAVCYTAYTLSSMLLAQPNKVTFFMLLEPYTLDLLPNEQNFDLDKSRQKCHHSLKEHRKISNIPKFRCEML